MNYLDHRPRMFHGGRVSNTVLTNTANRGGYAMGGSARPFLGPSPKPNPRMLPAPSGGPLRSMLAHAMGQRSNQQGGLKGLLPMGQQNSPFMRAPQRPQGVMAFAGGGPVSDVEMQYVDMGTGADGREDNIPADLSENEYIIDAETVALLGDGNPDAGAAKLDRMRENIRRHKGVALAEGAISDDALEDPLEYCDGGMTYAGGGRVGSIRRLLDLNDPNLVDEAGDQVYKDSVNKLKQKLKGSKVLDLNDPSLPSRRKDIGLAPVPSTQGRKAPNVTIESVLMEAIPTHSAGKSQLQSRLHELITGTRRKEDKLRALQKLSEVMGDEGPVSDQDLAQYLQSFSTKGFAGGGRVRKLYDVVDTWNNQVKNKKPYSDLDRAHKAAQRMDNREGTYRHRTRERK